ncbi:type II and III secretion system protein family protein [Pseudochrobactrum kiredjianiae]|uniref:Type II and III secretion system protein family protein n=1 Tax=Pseudochrobactrum kiredjianiae TaxID=386305 RepID=A0ABW3V4V6_9HYPH|nr:type II and III secretion system protein family protein [Pseudochrobactrum kiredjianiae]MDM7849679.1 type II and III secretion system protein family protein [Pseudochrobactrum kiredjianiae]
MTRLFFSQTYGSTQLKALLLSAALIIPVTFSEVVQAQDVQITSAGRAQPVNLGLGKSLVIDLPQDAYDILVANPTTADAVTRTARRIYLFGKAVGQTNIIIFGKDGEQIASLDLKIERDVSSLASSLRKYIPGSDIKIELINDNIVLTGTVQTPQDAAQAAKLANLLVSGGEATTNTYNTGNSVSSSGSGGSLVVTTGNDQEARRASKIINLITIVGEDQVTLKVTVAEVSRTVMKQLGVNMVGNASMNGVTFSGIAGSLPGGVGQNASNSLGIRTSNFRGYLQAMETAGAMKTLAEPTLTAISGEKAAFQVGGEYNVLDSVDYEDDGKRKNTLAKIEYGIGLEFMPTVLGPGRISLKVRTSVSEPTTEGSATQNTGELSPNIISLRKRIADTTVEIPSGGSMMIGGLIRDETRQSINGTPGLSKIPVLGTLFRSREFLRNETELVVIVTPYLVRSTARTELARPDDNLTPPSDAAGFVLGKVNRVYGSAKTNLPNGRYNGVVGFIYK